MNDIEAWLQSHQSRLELIARERQLDQGMVELAAVLVLTGHDDSEIFDTLRGLILTMDGQEDPLAAAPAALEEIRALANR